MSDLRAKLAHYRDTLGRALRTSSVPRWLVDAVHGCYTELGRLALSFADSGDPAVVAAIARAETLLEICGVAPTAPQAVVSVPSKSSAPARAQSDTTVMVIEDDREVSQAVRGVLEDAGYRVIGAYNGKQALSLLTHVDPAIILLDMMMPVMDGWQFVARLRRNAAWSQIPLIVISARAAVNQPERLAAALQKPLDLRVLLRTVQRHAHA